MTKALAEAADLLNALGVRPATAPSDERKVENA
jgi:hypothetical protein